MGKNDTTTELGYLGVPGADILDEALVTQSDGLTEAKRPRVDVTFASDDPQEQMVRRDNPLPTQDDAVLEMLRELNDNVKALRLLIEGNI